MTGLDLSVHDTAFCGAGGLFLNESYKMRVIFVNGPGKAVIAIFDTICKEMKDNTLYSTRKEPKFYSYYEYAQLIHTMLLCHDT